MAGHFEPDLRRQMIARFMDEVRDVPVRFGIQQPLKSADLSADITLAIGQLSMHMHLEEADSQWLMCLASHLEPELGATLVPALWRLKEDVMTLTERGQRAREPSPFSLPPAAAENGDEEACAAQAPVWRKRPRSSSPQYPRTVPDLNAAFFSSVPPSTSKPVTRRRKVFKSYERHRRRTIRDSDCNCLREQNQNHLYRRPARGPRLQRLVQRSDSNRAATQKSMS
ncbi:unnamed protein product [Symbiodinium sp. CCMP2592]|nr:unnamed protein product [Symbiodinium sp. CCMP2592]